MVSSPPQNKAFFNLWQKNDTFTVQHLGCFQYMTLPYPKNTPLFINYYNWHAFSLNLGEKFVVGFLHLFLAFFENFQKFLSNSVFGLFFFRQEKARGRVLGKGKGLGLIWNQNPIIVWNQIPSKHFQFHFQNILQEIQRIFKTFPKTFFSFELISKQS